MTDSGSTRPTSSTTPHDRHRPDPPLRDPLGHRIHEQLAHQAVRQAQTMLGLLRQAPPSLPQASVRRVAAAGGAGVRVAADSSAILARWLTDPSTRDFPLNELAVVTGMTGPQWPRTRQLVETHLLPLMATSGVRYLQVARRGPRQADGIDILSDTRVPDRLHLVGAWTLADEMFDGAAVPQTTGDRLCMVDCTHRV